MEVGIRLGVCNNSPAEWISPENGWRLSVTPNRRHDNRLGASLPKHFHE